MQVKQKDKLVKMCLTQNKCQLKQSLNMPSPMHRDSRQEHVKSFGRQGNIMSDNNWRAEVHDTHWNYLEVFKMMCELKSSVSVVRHSHMERRIHD